MNTSMNSSDSIRILVEENRRLVGSIVNRFLCQFGLNRDHAFAEDLEKDLFEEGVRGLLRAAETFDPARAKFSTYAVWWIRKYVRDMAVDVASRRRKTVSLDAPVGDDKDGDRLIDRISDDLASEDVSSDVFDNVARRDECDRAARLLSRLPDRDRRIVELRLGLHGAQEHTLREISDKMGISAQRVDILYKKALGDLRRQMAA